MADKKNICVYCASSTPRDARLLDLARDLGALIAKRGYGLVYGGANVGLMREVALSVLQGGAPVCGVIPGMLNKREASSLPLTEIHHVKTLTERKVLMASKSCAFVALPGGIGTMDELCECLDWSHLGQHRCPVIIYNAFGYYDKLLEFFDGAVQAGFMTPNFRQSIIAVNSLEEVFKAIESYIPPALPTWLQLDEE